METDSMPLECRLAAIIILLSASALRGPTSNKVAALRAHLSAALRDTEHAPHLKDAIEQALAGWQSIDCHPKSISVDRCPLTVPGQALH